MTLFPPPDQPNGSASNERERAEEAFPAAPSDGPDLLAQVLHRARLFHQMSLRDVERQTGIPNAHVSQVERGVIRRAEPELLVKLCELYGIDAGAALAWVGYALAPVPHDSEAAQRLLTLLADLSDEQMAHVVRFAETLVREPRSNNHTSAYRSADTMGE